MNITPLLNSLSQISDLAAKGGALNLARLSTSGPGATSGSGTTAATGTTAAAGGLANESVFLQLLVAQLKNQDPQNPADGTAFVTQLAQFTTLEQDTQSTTDLNQILGLLQASSATGGKSSQTTAAA
jgi:flagellar hook assembly protein FlgD